MAGDIEAKIRITGDSSSAVLSITRTEDSMKSLQETASRSSRDAAAALDSIKGSVDGLAESFKSLRDMAEIALSFDFLKEVTGSLIETQVQFQQIHFALQAATGSAQAAGEEFDYIVNTADRLGLSVQTLGQHFGSFMVSARAAGVTTQQAHDLFQAASEASTVFHLSLDRQRQVMYALEQMMAIGVIRTHQLKLQLGQALPGAYENFARAVQAKGIDFTEALRKGTLSIKDWGDTLKGSIKAAFDDKSLEEAEKGLNASLGRMQSSIFMFKKDMSDGLFAEIATKTIEQITGMVKATDSFLKGTGGIVTVSALGVGGLAVLGKGFEMLFDKITPAILGLAQMDEVTKAHLAAKVEDASRTMSQTIATAENTAANIANIEVRRTSLQATIAANDAAISLATQELNEAKILLGTEVQVGRVAAAEDALTALRQRETVLFGKLTTVEAELAVARSEEAVATAAVTVAEEAQTVVTGELAAATGVLGTAMTVATSLGEGLLALVGGWAGLLAIAAGGILYLALKETDAEKQTNALKDAIKQLTEAQNENIASAQAMADKQAGTARQSIAGLKEEVADLEMQLKELSSSGTDPEGVGGLAIAGIINAKNERINELEALLGQESDASSMADKRQSEYQYNTGLDKRIQNAGSVDDLMQLNKGLHKETHPLNDPDGRYNLKEFQKEIEDRRKAISDLAEEKIGGAKSDEAATRAKNDEIAALAQLDAWYKTVADSMKEYNKVQDEKEVARREKEAAAKEKKTLEEEDSFITRTTKKTAEIRGQAETENLSRPQREYLKAMAGLDEDEKARIKRIQDTVRGEDEQAAAIKRVTDAINEQKEALGYRLSEEMIADNVKAIQEIDRWIEQVPFQSPEKDTPQSLKTRHDKLKSELKAKLDSKSIGGDQADAEMSKLDAAMSQLDAKAVHVQTEWEKVFTKVENSAEQHLGTAFTKIFSADDSDIYDKKRQEFEKQLAAQGLKQGTPEYDKAMNDMLSHVDTLTERFKMMGDSFVLAIQRMAAELAASELMKVLKSLADMGLNYFMGGDSGSGAEFTGGGSPSISNVDTGGDFAPAPLPFGPGHSSGGPIYGPGSDTSDSVLTPLSDGEFVVRARAVRKYGLDFLTRVNEGSFATRSRGFAMGGYADGGSVHPVSPSASDVQVNVINHTGQPSTQQRRKDGMKEIIDVVIGAVASDIQNNGTVGQAVENKYGVRKVGIRRG